MTVRLLAAYDKYPANAIVTLDSGTEAGLVTAKLASVDLTGGAVYFAPVTASRQSQPLFGGGYASLKTGEQAALSLPEGQALIVTGAAGTTGTVQRLDASGAILQSWTIGAGTLPQIGAYSGTQRLLISCSAGSVEATVGDAVLGAAKVGPAGGLLTRSGSRASLRPVGVSAVSRELGFTWQGQNTGAGLTIVNQRPALGPYRALRVHYTNYDPAPWTVTTAKAAASPTHQNDGTGLAWASLSFATAGTNIVPGGIGGSSPDAVPSFLSSDVLPQNSVDRTDDVTKKRLHQFRTYAAGVQNTLLLGNSTDAQTYNASALADGRQYGGRAPIGDAVTAITASQPLEINAFQQPAIVEFFYDSPARTLAFVGDSLTQGKSSTADNTGWPLQLSTRLASRGDGVIYSQLNFATSSQTFATSCAIAKKVIAQFRPDALFIFAWSPNTNPTSDAVMFNCRAQLLEIAQLASINGVNLVVCTSGPVNAYPAVTDARIKAQNTWVRQMAAAGAWAMADMAAAIENPLTPGQINAAYDSGDGLHYSNLGYGVMASVAEAAV